MNSSFVLLAGSVSAFFLGLAVVAASFASTSLNRAGVFVGPRKLLPRGGVPQADGAVLTP